MHLQWLEVALTCSPSPNSKSGMLQTHHTSVCAPRLPRLTATSVNTPSPSMSTRGGACACGSGSNESGGRRGAHAPACGAGQAPVPVPAPAHLGDADVVARRQCPATKVQPQGRVSRCKHLVCQQGHDAHKLEGVGVGHGSGGGWGTEGCSRIVGFFVLNREDGWLSVVEAVVALRPRLDTCRPGFGNAMSSPTSLTRCGC